MSENPYAPTTKHEPRSARRETPWLLWLGITSLLLAIGCAAATVAMLQQAFAVAAEAGSTPSADELAAAVGNSLVPAYGIVPFALAGLVLLVVGFLRRRSPPG